MNTCLSDISQSQFYFQVTGNKAPTLLQLSTWLEKNTSYDVEPKWGTIAKVCTHIANLS